MEFEELAAAIAERLQSGTRTALPRLICIDGPAGAGKTTLAEALAMALSSTAIVHMDDLYNGWAETLAEDLADRLQSWLLAPLAAGEVLRLPRYDWLGENFSAAEELPAADYLIVEGVGSGQRVMRSRADLIVFLDIEADIGCQRVANRDGAEVASHMADWQLLERSHFAREGTRQAAELYWAWR